MNFESVKRAFKHLGLWLVLVAVVSLLTLLFNLFGTLSSAALTGMMLGAIKHKRWLTLAVSSVFPGVVFLLMYLSKVELEGQKQVVVPALCFSVFWVIYFLTRVMVGYEGKEADSRAQPASAPAKSTDTLRLDQLQGRWVCESTDSNGLIKKKVIQISGGRLVLSEFGNDDQERLRVEGVLRLEDSGPSKALVVSATRNKSSDGAV